MFCYRPGAAPAIGPAPSLHQGGITFGSFNNIAKLSNHTLRLWARALHAVPGSRLLLKSRATGDAATRANITHFMHSQGISATRLMMRGRETSTDSHLALYNEVDIALDPFPYNGATTTCEALWMGVPVVTLRGRTHTSRMGASILSAAGQSQWVADSDDTYVDGIQELAKNAATRVAWRDRARATLQASALMDEPGFASCFESAINSAWAQKNAQQLAGLGWVAGQARREAAGPLASGTNLV
jgi:predicted O-linked N-acetylglucosamine transferase (SPINDLY family)